jgi:hypothetical protein
MFSSIEKKKRISSAQIECPCCNTKVKFEHHLNTDWYGILRYYSCKVFKERLVSQNGGELNISAPR